MADYNVNMKQWNGTSFDNVLPLAYNSKTLDGKSYDDIVQYVQNLVANNAVLLHTGSYVGNGTYGINEYKEITFPFKPELILFPSPKNSNKYKWTMCIAVNSIDGKLGTVAMGGISGISLYTYFDTSSNTFSWHMDTDDALDAFNGNGIIYTYIAIGGHNMGGKTDFIITESGNFIVPRTGRYMLELYGGGGGVSDSDSIIEGRAVQGGSSCQRYDSISLTAGDSIPITIGVKGTYTFDGTTRDATGTSFGTYSVDGGGTGNGGTATGGSGSGNLGTSGRVVRYSDADYNNNSGTFGSTYGRGGWGGRSSSSSGGKSGTDGAVYLKYLGA